LKKTVKNRKAIILSGGLGTRLYPLTLGVSKQLLPVYDKPMLYYPLCTVMESGIREILVISTASDLPAIQRLFGDGSSWGVSISYCIQEEPKGIAHALLLAETFLNGSCVLLILGDNIFYSPHMAQYLKSAHGRSGATVFAVDVPDPQRYGIVAFDEKGMPSALEEKPKNPRSSYAVTGLYFYDDRAIELAKKLQPSARGELEITDLNRCYLEQGKLCVQKLDEGYWIDAGTFDSLLSASNWAKSVVSKDCLLGSPDAFAYKNGWITRQELIARAQYFQNSGYGGKLLSLLDEKAQ
jgi:glucose-1-phosphate thymidylyltransferase